MTSTNPNPLVSGSLGYELALAIAYGDTSTPITFDVGSSQTIALSTSYVSGIEAYGPTAYVIAGSGLNITLDGSGSPGLVIDGDGMVRPFAVENGNTLDLVDLTVSDGSRVQLAVKA